MMIIEDLKKKNEAFNGDINKNKAIMTKMAQDNEKAIGSIIQDTVEFSQEAMQRFMAERAGV